MNYHPWTPLMLKDTIWFCFNHGIPTDTISCSFSFPSVSPSSIIPDKTDIVKCGLWWSFFFKISATNCHHSSRCTRWCCMMPRPCCKIVILDSVIHHKVSLPVLSFQCSLHPILSFNFLSLGYHWYIFNCWFLSGPDVIDIFKIIVLLLYRLLPKYF